MATTLGNLNERLNLEPETTSELLNLLTNDDQRYLATQHNGRNLTTRAVLDMVEANPKNRRVFVTGLDPRVATETHDRMLRQEFACFGTIEHVSVPASPSDPPEFCMGLPDFDLRRDRAVSKGYAHILFTTRHAAHMALELKRKIENQEIVCLKSSW